MLFALPLGALLVWMLGLTWVGLQAPAPDAPPTPVAAASGEEGPKKRIYFSLLSSVTTSLPQGMGTVSLDLGVALDAGASFDLLTRLRDNPQQAQAGLADAVLSMAEEISPESGPMAMRASLRAALPEKLRAALNAQLVAAGEAPIVLEVFVLDWAVAE